MGGRLKKYFYISVLLGTIVLAGCTDNKEVTKESASTKQSIVIGKNENTMNKEEAAPISLNLTQEQKEEYYKKYVVIIEKVNAENKEDTTLELEPITALD